MQKNIISTELGYNNIPWYRVTKNGKSKLYRNLNWAIKSLNTAKPKKPKSSQYQGLALPHIVNVIGVRKDRNKPLPIDAISRHNITLHEIKEHYKFIRETTPPKDMPWIVNTTKFMCISLGSEPETVILPNKKKVKLCRFSKPFHEIVMESQKTVLFNEIKEEIIHEKYKLTNIDEASCIITLTEFVIMGKVEHFPVGFTYNPQSTDKNGKRIPLTTVVRKIDGTFERIMARTNMASHFIYEEDQDRIEDLRQQLIYKLQPFEIKPPKTKKECKVNQPNVLPK